MEPGFEFLSLRRCKLFQSEDLRDIVCSGEFASPRRRSPAYRAPGKQR
jgi:hypothetical protein